VKPRAGWLSSRARLASANSSSPPVRNCFPPPPARTSPMAAHGNPRWGETPSSRAFNAPALHPPERPWSRRRLQTFILLCFVAQLLFILAFGERHVPTLKPSAFGTGIHLLADEWSMGQLAAFSELSDPSVFALPSLQGFSKAGWLTCKPPADEFATEPQPPKWLQLNSESLGRDLAAFLATNTAAPRDSEFNCSHLGG